MVKKEDLDFSRHARLEAYEDGISESEILEAISRGKRTRQNGHYIITYKYFTVVFKISGTCYRIITVHTGYPRKWQEA